MDNTKIIRRPHPYFDNATAKSLSPETHQSKRVSLRKRVKSTRYAGDEYNWTGFEENPSLMQVTKIKIEDEKSSWDYFYTTNKESEVPFSGFDTVDTVRIILFALSKMRRKRRPGFELSHDVIMEVGHGKFPLIWDLYNASDNFSYYGIEFSTVAFHEAVRHRFSGVYAPEDVFKSNVEFLCSKSLSYFNPDGSTNLDLIFPNNLEHSSLRPAMVTLALGKSFLDYLSSRLILSVNLSSWSMDPRIPQDVVDIFDSIVLALKEPKYQEKEPALFILVEPDDEVKFKDHIGIITKVIYTSTFVNDSPSKYLRLVYVQRDKISKAVCYGLARVDSVYDSYSELRYDIYRIAKNAYSKTKTTDEDWLLPYNVPVKWMSTDAKDFDNLTLL